MSTVIDHLLEAKVWAEGLMYRKRTRGPELENNLSFLIKECKPINRKLKSTFPDKQNIASNTWAEGIPSITLTRVSWNKWKINSKQKWESYVVL